MRTLYDVLHLLPDASDKQIQSAYRVLASELHPDVNSSADAAERFKEVQAAYDVLGNQEARRVYDAELRASSSKSSSTPLTKPASPATRRSAITIGVIGLIGVALLTFAAVGRQQEAATALKSATPAPTTKVTAVPTATTDPRIAELMDFAQQYKSKRARDQAQFAELNKLYPPFPDHRLTDAEVTARALELAAFHAVEADLADTTVRRAYEALPRTPATRGFIEALLLLMDKRVEKSEAWRDRYRALARNADQATLDKFSKTIDRLDTEIERMWRQLEDDIEDALIRYGLSWASLGGRP